MKYSFSFDDAQTLSSVIGIIGGDSKTEIVFGVGDEPTCITVYGGVRQARIQLKAKSEATEKKVVIFESKTFNTLLGAVLALKKDIILDVTDAVAYVEVEGKARLEIVPLSEEEITGIEMNPKTLLLQAKAKAKNALRAFKVGGSMTQNTDNANGMNNVLLTVSGDKAFITSINGLSGGTSSFAFEQKNSNEVIDGNLKAYLEDKKIPELMLPIPKQIAGDIASLLAISETTLIAASAKAIHLMPSGSVMYSAVLGANAFTQGKDIINQMVAMPKVTQVTVDAANLKESVSLLKKTMELGSKKPAMVCTLTPGEVRFESAINAESCVRVSAVEGNGPESDKGLDPSLFLEAISPLSGNVTLSYAENDKSPVVITSGTVEQPSNDDAIIILPVIISEETTEGVDTESV